MNINTPGLALVLAGAMQISFPATAHAAAAAHTGSCTRTSNAALSSCHHAAEGDYWIGVGVCQNLTSATSRSRCLDDAANDRVDARDECQDQHDSRLEVCGEVGEAPYAPNLDPDRFVNPAQIGKSVAPNPFFPLIPGRRVVLEGPSERVETTVTGETTRILGIRCAAVHDVGIEDGEITEDTIDWFAQDVDGNVWYFGEISQQLEDGILVSIDGSWKTGVDGAKPGIVMKAAPAAGDVYRQEFALGNAEDMGKVLNLNGSVTTPAYTCRGNCLVTRDFSPLEPDARENKYYAPGIGLILEHDLETGEKVKLIEVDE